MLTLNDLRFIMLYLLRSLTVVRLAVAGDRLQPAHFRDMGSERCFRFLYDVVRRHFQATGQLPSTTMLIMEVRRTMEQLPDYFSAAQLEEINTLLTWAFQPATDALDSDAINLNYARALLQRFLVERTIRPMLDDPNQELTSEVLASLSSRFQQLQMGDRHNAVNPFMVLTEHAEIHRELTGTAWLDTLMFGGLLKDGGELIGFIAGPGWGKTTAAIQVGVNLARRQQHVAYFSYEQAVTGPMAREINQRVISSATGIPIDRLRSGTAALTPGERERLQREESIVGNYLHMIDMSGAVPSQGTGAFAELEEAVVKMRTLGWPVRLVIVDFFGQMVTNHINSGIKTSKMQDRRYFTAQQMSRAISIAATYGCSFFICEQACTEAVNRKPQIKPQQTDAQDAKNFSQLMQFCLNLTRPDPEYNRCQIHSTKARGGPQKEVQVFRNGPMCRFELLDEDDHFSYDQRGNGEIIRAGDVNRVLDVRA